MKYRPTFQASVLGQHSRSTPMSLLMAGGGDTKITPTHWNAYVFSAYYNEAAMDQTRLITLILLCMVVGLRASKPSHNKNHSIEKIFIFPVCFDLCYVLIGITMNV